MKGFEIERGITIGALIEKLQTIDPTAKIQMYGNITIGTKDLPLGETAAIMSTKGIFGMTTDSNPYGIPFIKGENEHPAFAGYLAFENEETDYTLIISGYFFEPGAFRRAEDEFTITAVKTLDEWDTYGDYIHLIKCGENLIGYIIDCDDAEDSFIKGPDLKATDCLGLIRKAVTAVETGGAVSAEIYRTGNIIELLYAAYAYTFMDDWSHLNVNTSGIQQVTGFDVLFEDISFVDDEDDEMNTCIGLVVDNAFNVRMVYIPYDGDNLERVVAASMMLEVTKGGYRFNEQGFLSAKGGGKISGYDENAGLANRYYDTDTFAGAVAAVVDIVEELDDDFDDEDDEKSCQHPDLTCTECPDFGTDSCPYMGEDDDEDEDD